MGRADSTMQEERFALHQLTGRVATRHRELAPRAGTGPSWPSAGHRGGDRETRIAVAAALVVTGAGLVYLLSLAVNVVAGFPMPPVVATRVLASVSVLASAPAFLILVFCLRRSDRKHVGNRS